uniref:PRLI-interacting factor A n=1 Tax=Davidia involucrata TaxID=16924 RepID=A0A5B7A167_DAVIN
MDRSQTMNRSYGVWPPPLPPAPVPEDPIKFQTYQRPNFASTKPGRSNWKGKKSDNRNEMRRKDPLGIGNITAGGYKPPNLNELQFQNRLKARRFYPKKKFNNRFAPFAPRNTTSFIIRAKKSGGIASLVSPCPVTPAVLPTPIFSPSREVLVDMAKEEWGVDGYGSMKGLIRLRSPGHEAEEEEEGGGGSSDSDVEEHVEVERRLDHDLSRFEMIYPNSGDEHTTNVLENRVDDQDTHITQLEEENLTLKERLFLMERELEDLRRRVQCLETDGGIGRVRDNNDEASENASEYEGGGDVCSEKSVGDGE